MGYGYPYPPGYGYGFPPMAPYGYPPRMTAYTASYGGRRGSPSRRDRDYYRSSRSPRLVWLLLYLLMLQPIAF